MAAIWRADLLTLFPEMCRAVLGSSMLGRAQSRGIVDLRVANFRDFAVDRHRTVDDEPFGGGPGMVLKPEPIFAAVEAARASGNAGPVILMSPQGRPFSQAVAKELAGLRAVVVVCGHYEGFDERVCEHLADDEISLGDFVLTGGELPALALLDATVRLLPGVLGNPESATHDTFADGLLEYPQYTRPERFRDWSVPPEILSGHHARIAQWRRRAALRRTLERRPDLLVSARLTPGDRLFLQDLGWRDDAE
jgi:tRNA (guanine37-N1)-methyltransferase